MVIVNIAYTSLILTNSRKFNQFIKKQNQQSFMIENAYNQIIRVYLCEIHSMKITYYPCYLRANEERRLNISPDLCFTYVETGRQFYSVHFIEDYKVLYCIAPYGVKNYSRVVILVGRYCIPDPIFLIEVKWKVSL